MLTVQGAVHSFGQWLRKVRRGQFEQRTAEQFPLLKSGVKPASVRVPGRSCVIGHQNQALRVVEDLAREVALPMQLRLVGSQAGDIQHQPANLQHAALVVIHPEGVNQHVNQRTVLAPKGSLKIAQAALFLHDLRMLLPLLGSEIKLGRDIDLQQFFAAAVAEHPYHGVIDFHKSSARRAEEEAFLNIVEEFAVPPFRLATVGDVFQNVNGLQAFPGGVVHARC